MGRTSLIFLTRAAGTAALFGFLAPILAAQFPSASSVTLTPGSSGDDTVRIQNAIDASTGAVRFASGVYKLNGPLVLRPNRTYIGEGSWHPRYGSTLLQQTPGAPIFTVKGRIASVTIIGLTFDGLPGIGARGIAAAADDHRIRDATALLADSTIRDSYFLTELAECIDLPMISTRIERNQFGQNGGPAFPRHRHIHSVEPSAALGTNANWIVGNIFRFALGSESVLFETGVPLHIIGNDFEANDADTALRVRGTPHVEIKGNWFEANRGQAHITLAKTGNPMVRLEDNYYVMQGGPIPYSNVCNGKGGQGTCFIIDLEPNLIGPNLGLTATRVFMGYEAGGQFASEAELVPASAFGACQLIVTGPFHFGGYAGHQADGNPSCH